MDNILIYVVIGFFAQMIDGSLGMGYKVSSTTFLLSTGIEPKIASASVHTAGIFTSAVSGYSHYRFKNYGANLVKQLAIPGIIGGVIGAILATQLPTDIIRPAVALYLLLMGVRIIFKALNRKTDVQANINKRVLGLFGGFFDAIGGGGWGPIVTSTLVGSGHNPRYVIGSVNIAEWFVTVMQAITFFISIGHEYNWSAIAGIMIGGVVAAPMAAYVSKRLPLERLMLAVGVLIVLLSARTLITSFTGG
jgi:uncharacterized protein